VSAVDLIDKGIFYALDGNCRISYEALARRFNISANAIKKRVTKLQECGILKRFGIWLSLGMIDAEMFVAFVTTDGSKDDEALINQIGINPMVHRATFLSNGGIILFGEYVGAQGLAELSRFLRGLNGITQVEIHTLLTEKGGKIEFKPLQLKVLRELKRDARMSIVKLAKRTGLNARTIRRVLDKLGANKSTTRAFVIRNDVRPENRAHSEPVHFRTIWNLNSSGNISYVARITYDENQVEPQKLVEWLEKQFSREHWYSYASATEPILFSTFVVENMAVFEQIAHGIKRGSMIKQLEILVLYPMRHFKGLRELQLDEILKQAGA
jgi:DNA-binding Lrp family transcriptional regulator